MTLKPLGDRLIVVAVEEEAATPSGVVAPDTATEKPRKGRVVAVADPHAVPRRDRAGGDVAEGDEVLYEKYGGTEITVDGEDLLVLRESDVLGKVTGDPRPAAASAGREANDRADEIAALRQGVADDIARLKQLAR
jgi:chaperonin GroES